MAKRVFGHVPGYPEGSLFEDRAELHAAGIHRHRQDGIAGSQTEGAESIVLSGGYEDDQDFGDTIIYTGYGGRDSDTEQQTRDQPFTRWNRALAYSSQSGLPVRVILGSGHDSPYSPALGYSHDGLYAVEEFWPDFGKSGEDLSLISVTGNLTVRKNHRISKEPLAYHRERFLVRAEDEPRSS